MGSVISNSFSFVLTFDDTTCRNFKAARILEANHVPATFFLSAGRLEKHDVEEIGSFHEIGSHACTHRRLTDLSTTQVLDELIESKRIIEEFSGKPVVSFSFPYGKANQSIRNLARMSGYDVGRGVRIAAPFRTVEDPFDIPIFFSDISLTTKDRYFYELVYLLKGKSSDSSHLRNFYQQTQNLNPYQSFKRVCLNALENFDHSSSGKSLIFVCLFHARIIGYRDAWQLFEEAVTSLMEIAKPRTFGDLRQNVQGFKQT